MKLWQHFKTITHHKNMVMKGCFRVGLYRQGLAHDLSKYMPSEFWVGVKYYQGTQSPNNAERDVLGYSSAWLHHKGRNKHHYEYWLDYGIHAGDGIVPVPMPMRYIVETELRHPKTIIRGITQMICLYSIIPKAKQAILCIQIPERLWNYFFICLQMREKKQPFDILIPI